MKVGEELGRWGSDGPLMVFSSNQQAGVVRTVLRDSGERFNEGTGCWKALMEPCWITRFKFQPSWRWLYEDQEAILRLGLPLGGRRRTWLLRLNNYNLSLHHDVERLGFWEVVPEEVAKELDGWTKIEDTFFAAR